MAKYKLSKDVVTGKELPFILLGEHKAIPFDPANTDYQEYLKWVDEGNTAEAAD